MHLRQISVAAAVFASVAREDNRSVLSHWRSCYSDAQHSAPAVTTAWQQVSALQCESLHLHTELPFLYVQIAHGETVENAYVDGAGANVDGTGATQKQTYVIGPYSDRPWETKRAGA